MFSGLVEAMGEVVDAQSQPPGKRLTVGAANAAVGTEIGESIAVNGCCLTVVEIERDCLTFEAGPETLARTNLGLMKVGDLVNLERSLRMGDRLGGHLVTGHIDTVAILDDRIVDRDWMTMWFRVSPSWTCQMVSKGSIAVDGVSLTLVEVTQDRFNVQLIPHTQQVTTLGKLSIGGSVNIETDLLAKYVQQQLETRFTPLSSPLHTSPPVSSPPVSSPPTS